MGNLTRFGISMDEELLERFDKLISDIGYRNRSEAIRDLIRDRLVDREWKTEGTVAGCILIVYDHHKNNLSDRITDIQHDYLELIASTQHIHLDSDNCMEILIVKGKAPDIEYLFNRLKALKGIKKCDMLRATTGREIK